ncbi:MAG: hypothetical protein ACRDLF_12275, partial [Solirubrobacteraceae bacterium]
MTSPAAHPVLAAADGREPLSPPTGGAPPGVPPDRAPFHSALEVEQARTATAEGQQQSRSKGHSPATSRDTPAHAPRGARAGVPSTVASASTPAGAAVAGVEAE